MTLICKKLYTFSVDLIKYLNILDKPYTFEEIKDFLIEKSKNINYWKHMKINSDKSFDNCIKIVLNKEGSKLFGKKYNYCGLYNIINIIYNKYTIRNLKPDSYCYEYNQQPIEIITIKKN